MRTQVGIIGAGPAGLFLAHLLERAGIESVVLEARSRAHVEERIRAGVIEHWASELLRATGIGERMDREGLVHHGIELRFAGEGHRIDFAALAEGRGVTVYGQHEVVRDLIAQRLADGGAIAFEAKAIGIDGIETERPAIRYRKASEDKVLRCDIVAGCDGFHGIARASMPAPVTTLFERVYPFAWLGVLAEAPPVSDELIYAHHARGFALFSMRSPTVTRLYLQCTPDEDLAAWSDDRIWDELARRVDFNDGRRIVSGPILQKGLTAMRSFVAEPMRHGRLFLAGDAAHIVPPTGAKGMNLAIADVTVLARAIERFYGARDESGFDAYSSICLKRVWKAQRFSWWMTSMLHRFPDDGAFDQRRQLAELDYVTSSRAASASLAENYVGLPLV